MWTLKGFFRSTASGGEEEWFSEAGRMEWKIGTSRFSEAPSGRHGRGAPMRGRRGWKVIREAPLRRPAEWLRPKAPPFLPPPGSPRLLPLPEGCAHTRPYPPSRPCRSSTLQPSLRVVPRPCRPPLKGARGCTGTHTGLRHPVRQTPPRPYHHPGLHAIPSRGFTPPLPPSGSRAPPSSYSRP